jgi:CheY-like chemotaxis protein
VAREAYILVVDDDPIMLSLVSERLELAGYRVTSATDAWQSIVQAQGLKIGLILTDVMMPGVGTGVDAYKKLRALPNLSKELPVIFMTGLKLDEIKKQLPEDPKIRLISKPIDFKLLETYIKELTGVDRSLHKDEPAA